MGTVWAARAPSGLEVAVKVLRGAAGESATAAARMLREASVLERLAHRHIVAVLDAGEDRALGVVFIVQRWLRGEDLRARLTREGRLSIADALAVIEPLADALACAHAAGVVHRDIKPENLFLARDEDGGVSPTLIDFGIAFADEPSVPTLTSAGTVLGTPHYMSPEQVRGERPLDGRSDLWSLGVVLNVCLAGGRPCDGASASAVIAKIVTEAPQPIDGVDDTSPVAALLRQTLDRDRAARFASAAEMRDAVRAAREGRAVQAHEESESRSERSSPGGWLDALAEHSTAPLARPRVAMAAEGDARAASRSDAPLPPAEPLAAPSEPPKSVEPSVRSVASRAPTGGVSRWRAALAVLAATAMTLAVVASLRSTTVRDRAVTDATRTNVPAPSPVSAMQTAAAPATAPGLASTPPSDAAVAVARDDVRDDAGGARVRASGAVVDRAARSPSRASERAEVAPSLGARELRRRFRNGAPVLPP
jgi:serine/threonine-protein kinase